MAKVKLEQWGTRLGIILAVSGSAVGLGNFLRFPGQAAQYGGGAFMIPYFCALIFLGIPIGWAEWSMARYGGRKGFHSGPAILGVVGRGKVARYLGVLSILIPLAVSFYYTFVEAWCLGYTWHFLVNGGVGVDPSTPLATQNAKSAEFFVNYTGDAANGAIFKSSIETLVFWGIVFAINIWLIYRGISGGIEKFCSYAMPLMAVCAVVVLIRVLTLEPNPANPEQNVLNGLGSMWNPDWSALANPAAWLAAAGQIFFSLSVGFGVILNYASYLRKKDDIALSGLTASATNEVFEVGFGGLITLPAAFVFLGAVGTMEAAKTGTFGLGFKTLPVVFAQMGPLGQYVGAIFFFMLFLAAITSSISMYQPTLAFLQESLGVSRIRATALMVSVCFIGSACVMYFSKGGEFFGTIDDWVGTFFIFILAAVQIICFSWIFGIERGWRELHAGAKIKVPSIFKFVMLFVAPVYLLVVFVAFCYNNLPVWIGHVAESPMRQGALVLVAGVTLFLVLCIAIGEKRWRDEGLDVDDSQPLND
ncbi:MAG: sodium-dependent transporter [Pirellulaceae bacterium]